MLAATSSTVSAWLGVSATLGCGVIGFIVRQIVQIANHNTELHDVDRRLTRLENHAGFNQAPKEWGP